MQNMNLTVLLISSDDKIFATHRRIKVRFRGLQTTSVTNVPFQSWVPSSSGH